MLRLLKSKNFLTVTFQLFVHLILKKRTHLPLQLKKLKKSVLILF